MAKKVIVTVLTNIALFIVFYISFFIAAFLMGYASNDKHEDATWRLYILFGIGNLVASIYILHLTKKLSRLYISITLSLIVFLYGLFAVIYG